MRKDIAKWLLTFAPLTAVFTLTLTIAPRINTSAGISSWIRGNPIPVGAIVTTVLATFTLIALGCYVMQAEATPIRELRERCHANWLSNAFSTHAVGLPHFAASDIYEAAANRVSAGESTAPGEQAAVAETNGRILELSEADNTRKRFKIFSWGYAICMITIVAGLTTAALSLPTTLDPVTKPTPVTLHLTPEAQALFTEATSCTTVADTSAIAIAGRWDHPTLRLAGPGCDAETTRNWVPPNNLDILATPK